MPSTELELAQEGTLNTEIRGTGSVMSKRSNAFVIILIVAFSALAFTILVPIGTHFHYEVQSPSEDTRPGYVWFDALEDCNLTISFSDDTPLLFSMDIDLYQSTTPALVYEFEYFDTEQSSHIHIQLIGASRIRSVTLVLEAGRSFDIVATRCANLNTTITYSNNSLLGGRQFHYEAEGSIHFTLGEDVDTSEGGLAVLIGSRPDPYNAALRPNMTYIDIALPDDMDGEVTFYQTDVDILENVGWPFQNLSTYGTDPFDTEALLKIDLYSKFAIAWLLA